MKTLVEVAAVANADEADVWDAAQVVDGRIAFSWRRLVDLVEGEEEGLLLEELLKQLQLVAWWQFLPPNRLKRFS